MIYFLNHDPISPCFVLVTFNIVFFTHSDVLGDLYFEKKKIYLNYYFNECISAWISWKYLLIVNISHALFYVLQAKVEYERLVSSVGQSIPLCQGIKVVPRSRMSILQRTDFHQLLAHHGGDMSSLKQELDDYDTVLLRVAANASDTKAYTYTWVIN